MRIKGLLHTNLCVICASIMLATVVLVSCQSDDADKNLVTIHPVIERNVETTVQTRALTGYSELTQNERQVLTAHAIAFNAQTDARNTEQDKHGMFAPLNEGWRSSVEVEPNYKYNLYTYSRTMPTATPPTFSFVSASNVSLTFSGLNIITEADPLVGVAAAGASLPNNNVPPANYPELTKGTFNIGTIPGADPNSTYKAFLALDHLYSKATISFRIDGTYSTLREVRIKDVQIKMNNGTLTGTHKYTFFDQQLTLDANRAIGGSALSINLFDGPNAKAEPNEGDDYIALTTTSREFGYYYFLPLNPTPAMYLEVTYDIYDLKGNLVRENQTAQNKNLFEAISHNGGSAAAGINYTVNVLVSPTYLYQLSDDDLELGLTVE